MSKGKMLAEGSVMKRLWGFLLSAGAVFFLGADWDIGSGIFGRWVLDSAGLVAYQYEMEQRTDPRAVWMRGKHSSTLHWHQLGNLRINAMAADDGFVQLFYNDSSQRWLNFFDPAGLHYSGGFSFILEGDTAFTTYYPFSPEGVSMKRVFGQGYFAKELEHNGLLVKEIIFAPAGDLPALVMQVRLKNNSPSARALSLFVCFDVNPRELIPFGTEGMNRRASRRNKFSPLPNQAETILVAQSQKLWGQDGGFPDRPMARDPELPDIFLALVRGTGRVMAVNPEELFLKDGWKGASGLKALAKSDAGKITSNNFVMLAISAVSLGPGEEKILDLAYGYAKSEKAEQLLSKIGDPEKALADTRKYWQESRPRLELSKDQFLSRELEWDNYYLVSSFLYDAYYGRHFAPQGGHYLYVSGVNGATRDLAAYILALTYYHPELAREMLELCLSNQETSGRLFYDFEGYGKRYAVPFRPSDLSLWLLWAATEYVFATRDFGFLQKELPYWPKEKGARGTVLEHLDRAYQHLEHGVGTGAHGLLKLKMSDWNDQMTLLVTKNDPLDFLLTYADGESTLNTAMACCILPLYSQLLKAAGEGRAAGEVDRFHARLQTALQKEWLDSGWFPRAYSALGKSFGKKEIYLEPQVFALLSDGLLTPEQQGLLLKNIDWKLRRPSKLGMLISDATKGALFAKPGEQERGGIWFAINGPASVALSRYNPEMAYEELKKNTLAWHAQEYPELWFGVWSGPDSFNSVFSKNPGGTWYASDLTGGPSNWPVQNNHAHAQFLWAMARLAGFEPTADGYTLNPALPLESYKLDTGTLGIEKGRGRMAGYFQFPASDWMMVSLKLPANFGRISRLKIDGRESGFQEQGEFIKFPVSFETGRKISWEIQSGK